MVQLNFTPEIEVFYMLLDRYLSIDIWDTSNSGVKSSWTSLCISQCYGGFANLIICPCHCSVSLVERLVEPHAAGDGVDAGNGRDLALRRAAPPHG